MLGKSEEEVWSSVKIGRVVSIVTDVLFKRLMQIFCYFVVRANNAIFEFTITYFPLMNIIYLITISIFCDVEPSQIDEDKRKPFAIGYGHIKAFIDFYYDSLAVIEIDIAMAMNMTSKVPKSLLKVLKDLEKFKDGEIIHKPFGVVIYGNNKKGELRKCLFQTNERYTNSHFMNIILCNK